MEVREAYESLPYPSKFFVQTNPDRLATLARLHGLEPARPNGCRVLELGCGNGSNLLAQAYNLKDSEFLGIDISGQHIADAGESAAELNLNNIEFRETDLMKMTLADYGKFDFIVGHGLISWMPLAVRDRVFELFGEMLKPDGIGYLCFNAYPGSYYREMVRSMLRHHTRGTDDPMSKVRESIEFLILLAGNTSETKIHKPILEYELERHFEQETADFFHDDLAEEYHPLYFHEFNSLLLDNGLQYLCEAEMHTMSSQGLSKEAEEMLSTIDDAVERVQYLDFFRGGIFHRTLFCRAELEPIRDLTPESIEGFLIASSIKPENADIDLTEKKAERFEGPKGQGLEVDHPLTKAAFILLGDHWGKPILLEDLLQDARQLLEKKGFDEADWEAQFRTAKTILLQIYKGTDLIDLRLHCADAHRASPEYPKINRLARWQLKRSDSVTSLYAHNVGVNDGISRRLLELMDGTRDRGALFEEITEFIDRSEEPGLKDELPEDLGQWLDSGLAELGKMGVFES